jgi:cobalt transporter subunit CbtA
MTSRFLLAAIAAGIIAGIYMLPLQYIKLIPIILQAEEFEGGHTHEPSPVVDHVHENVATHNQNYEVVNASVGQEIPEQSLDLTRIWNTILANSVTGAGYGLLLLCVSTLSGIAVSSRNGLIFGALGFLSVQLLPALGLPPELPGFPHVDLAARQVWWVATVAASIIGFALIFNTKSTFVRLIGLGLLIIPHFYGAPQPVDMSSEVPAYLASQFAVATLATTLFFWLVLGVFLGFFNDKIKS